MEFSIDKSMALYLCSGGKLGRNPTKNRDVVGHVWIGNYLTHRNPKYAGPNCFDLGHTFPS
jgi:hypothetical protein